ncbi:hypothetical protein CCM_04872 [Cordyceps militaris CM01]|uniref:Uncharacterized protein n=1 Tax=Cordyceps militaris (strain CM01) TaxID=983644 RepID=G3JF58_CORMM|nr:uncharacterized protein CCM_04872 [Cordyceps militaris CM01]EGX93498.1 hypothetical protein CCM_04872 [Cordyceps militaris CM01]
MLTGFEQDADPRLSFWQTKPSRALVSWSLQRTSRHMCIWTAVQDSARLDPRFESLCEADDGRDGSSWLLDLPARVLDISQLRWLLPQILPSPMRILSRWAM